MKRVSKVATFNTQISATTDRDQFQLATLSHLIDNKAAGYQELPEWPEEAPDPSVRNVEVTMPWLEGKSKERKKAEKKKSFLFRRGQ